jgi:hypothetical protein
MDITISMAITLQLLPASIPDLLIVTFRQKHRGMIPMVMAPIVVPKICDKNTKIMGTQTRPFLVMVLYLTSAHTTGFLPSIGPCKAKLFFDLVFF